MLVGLAMMAPVVLMNATSALDPQIDPGEEGAVLVVDLVLRLHRNVGRSMQNTHDRFPRRLAPSIEHRDDPSQSRRPATTLGGKRSQLLDGALFGPQRRVTEHDEIQDAQISRRREKSLGRRRDADPADRLHRQCPGMATDPKTTPMGHRRTLGHRREQRMLEVDDLPPATQRGRGQVGERRFRGQHERPRLQCRRSCPWLFGRPVQALRQPVPTLLASGPTERFPRTSYDIEFSPGHVVTLTATVAWGPGAQPNLWKNSGSAGRAGNPETVGMSHSSGP